VRILTVGIDVDLLSTRQAVLTSRGYDSLIATPGDVDEKLQSGKFDLVILSVMLSQEEKRRFRLNFWPARVRWCWSHWCGQMSCCAWWPRHSVKQKRAMAGGDRGSIREQRGFSSAAINWIGPGGFRLPRVQARSGSAGQSLETP